MYVYIKSEPGLYTVGFYSPDGKWHPERDFDNPDNAAKRVAWLNGSLDYSNIYVKMPPIQSYKVNFKIKEVKKAKPTIVLPEEDDEELFIDDYREPGIVMNWKKAKMSYIKLYFNEIWCD